MKYLAKLVDLIFIAGVTASSISIIGMLLILLFI